MASEVESSLPSSHRQAEGWKGPVGGAKRAISFMEGGVGGWVGGWVGRGREGGLNELLEGKGVGGWVRTLFFWMISSTIPFPYSRLRRGKAPRRRLTPV